MRTFRNTTTGIVERVSNEYTIAAMEASDFYEELSEQPAAPVAQAQAEVEAEVPQTEAAPAVVAEEAELPTYTAETPQA